MAVLYFKVEADYEEAIKCRDRIRELQREAESFSASTPTKEIAAWQQKVREASLELSKLTSKAAQAGAEMEHSLTEALTDSKTKVDEMNKAFEEQNAILKENEKNLQQYEQMLAKAKQNNDPNAWFYQKTVDRLQTQVDTQQVKVDDASADLKQARDDYERSKQALEDFRNEAAQTKEEIRGMKEEVRDASAEGRMAMQTVKMHTIETNQAMSNMPEPIKKATAGFKGMGDTIKMMMKSPYLFWLTALAGALQGLYRWVSRTAEGEDAFAKVQGAVSGAIEGVLNIVDKTTVAFVDFCKAVKNAFDTNTVLDFAKSIGETLWGELKKIGTVFVNLGDWIKTGFTDGWTSDAASEKLKALKDSFSDVGIVKAAEETGDILAKSMMNGMRNKEIEKEIRRMTAKYTKAIASLDSQIASEQAKMSRATATTNEKLQAQEKILELIRRKENMSVALASKKLELKRRELSENKYEEMSSTLQQEIADAEKAYIEAKTHQSSAVEDAQERLRNLKEQDLADMQRRAELNETIQKQYTREEIDLMHEQTQLEIDAMAEGSAKKMRQRQLNYEKEKEQIKRQFEDEQKEAKERAAQYWREHNPGKEWTDGVLDNLEYFNSDIDAEAREIYNEAMKAVYGKRDVAAKKADMDFLDVTEIVNQYKSVDQKRRELDEDYIYNRMRLEEGIAAYMDKVRKGTATDDELIKLEDARAALKELDDTHIKAALDLDTEAFQKNLKDLQREPVFFAAMRDASLLSTRTVNDLNKALEDNRQALMELSPDQLKVITDLMDKLADVSIQRNPFKAMKDAARELANAQIELAEKQELHNDALRRQEEAQRKVNEAQAEYDLLASNPNVDSSERETAFALLEEWRREVAKTGNEIVKTQNAVDNAVSNVFSKTNQLEKANQATLGVVREMAGTFRSLGSAIGGMDLGKAGEVFQKVADTIAMVMEGIAQAREMARQFDENRRVDMEVQAANTNNSAANIMNSASDKMLQAANGMKSGTTVSNPNGKKDVSVNNEKGASAMQNASAIMSGIQMGISVGSKMADLLKSVGSSGDAKYEKYAKKQAEVNKLTNSIKRYERAALAAQLAEKNWFGSSALRDLQSQWEVAQKSQKDYFDKLNERQAAYREQTKHDGDWLGNVVAGSVAGAVTGFAVGNVYGAMIGGIVGGIAGATTSYAEQALGNGEYEKQLKRAQDNLRIETQSKKKSFMWIGGRNQKTQDLRSWVKEKYGKDLFDPQTDMINIELAQEIISSYGDKLQGEAQQTIEEMIELAEQYEEYQQSLKDYVNSLYSPLANNMTDAIWSWYDDGVDALSAFRESASDTFRNIINDLMQQIVLKNIVGSFQDDIKELYDKYNGGAIDYNTLLRQVSQRTSDMVGAYEDSIPMLKDMITTMTGTVEDIMDVDLRDTGSNKTAGGFASMSQDTGQEMNGRLTAIQIGQEVSIGHLTTISTNVLSIATYVYEQNNSMAGIQQQIAASYLEIQGIHEDTTALVRSMKSVGDYLYNWDSHVKNL